MRAVSEDHYLVLGVPRTASDDDIRRAYRALALRYHPDRAGPEATAAFQRIAEAYRVLADSETRAAHDHDLRRAAKGRGTRPVRRDGGSREDASTPAATSTPTAPGVREGEYVSHGGRAIWRTGHAPEAWAASYITRLCGSLEALLASGAARRTPNGVCELALTAAEAATGGTATLDVDLPIACPTCLGAAEKGVIWCRRCEHAGTITDRITLAVTIPPSVADGRVFSFTTDPSGAHPPFRIRLRVS